VTIADIKEKKCCLLIESYFYVDILKFLWFVVCVFLFVNVEMAFVNRNNRMEKISTRISCDLQMKTVFFIFKVVVYALR